MSQHVTYQPPQTERDTYLYVKRSMTDLLLQSSSHLSPSSPSFHHCCISSPPFQRYSYFYCVKSFPRCQSLNEAALRKDESSQHLPCHPKLPVKLNGRCICSRRQELRSDGEWRGQAEVTCRLTDKLTGNDPGKNRRRKLEITTRGANHKIMEVGSVSLPPELSI